MNKWIEIAKKALGVVVELGCMEICSRGVDKLTNRYTNTASRIAMRTSGVFLGGYLGSKASEYLNETIDRGVKFAKDHGVKGLDDAKEEAQNDSPQ